MKNKMPNLQRRNLLQLMGALPAAGVAPAWAASGDVSLLDQSGAALVKLAVAKLAAALKAHGGVLHLITDIKQAKGFLIVVAAPRSPLVADFASAAAQWGAP